MTEEQFNKLGFTYRDECTGHLSNTELGDGCELKFTLFKTSQPDRWAIRGMLIYGEYRERVRQLSYIDSESLSNFIELGEDDDSAFMEHVIGFMVDTLVRKKEVKEIKDR